MPIKPLGHINGVINSQSQNNASSYNTTEFKKQFYFSIRSSLWWLPMSLRCPFLIILLLLFDLKIATAASIFNIQLEKNALSEPSDSMITLQEQAKTVFLVTHAHGIGRATIILNTGYWPEHIHLRFRYTKGQGFQSLEKLTITTSHLMVESDGKQAGNMPFYFLDGSGHFDKNASPAGEMSISVEKRPEALEVVLPPYMLAGSRKVTIAWIDAYR
jgi:hypothetical protein